MVCKRLKMARSESWQVPIRKSWEKLATDAGLRIVRSELHAFKQPDLEWYFQTADTTSENRQKC